MFQNLIDGLPGPVLIVDRRERISAANPGAVGLFGPNLVGRHYITVMRQPVLLDAVERVLKGTRRVEASYLGTEAQGDRTWLVTVAALDGPHGAAVASFEDQTMRAQAGQMRRDFVANVSHELKTPLTALMGFIETLKGAAREDPAAQDRFLTIMQREASRMDRLVGDLLSLSRVEAEERLQPTAEVDLAGLIRSVIHSLTPLADSAGVTLRASGLEGAVTVRGDADQLSQVATNLIENAIKYSGQGAEVGVGLEDMEDNKDLRRPAAVFTVHDTGEAIDPIHIPRLTERFYRIDSHRSREKGGTGLGLAIVKHIVNRHRGRLRIESAPGEGNVFSVILPRN